MAPVTPSPGPSSILGPHNEHLIKDYLDKAHGSSPEAWDAFCAWTWLLMGGEHYAIQIDKLWKERVAAPNGAGLSALQVLLNTAERVLFSVSISQKVGPPRLQKDR
jgi:hypothetical protein